MLPPSAPANAGGLWVFLASGTSGGFETLGGVDLKRGMHTGDQRGSIQIVEKRGRLWSVDGGGLRWWWLWILVVVIVDSDNSVSSYKHHHHFPSRFSQINFSFVASQSVAIIDDGGGW
ncbi:unnamed protein product [Lactuca virosa]|uniref:Secreted protein n=1 Tax=Lactuca virosa TaxID=75947 RepID=A0AAU9LZ34_9ASTR|nr:unnamed protein product [Lactuca virosa]